MANQGCCPVSLWPDPKTKYISTPITKAFESLVGAEFVCDCARMCLLWSRSRCIWRVFANSFSPKCKRQTSQRFNMWWQLFARFSFSNANIHIPPLARFCKHITKHILKNFKNIRPGDLISPGHRLSLWPGAQSRLWSHPVENMETNPGPGQNIDPRLYLLNNLIKIWFLSQKWRFWRAF